jgi:3-dehydroquinate synthase
MRRSLILFAAIAGLVIGSKLLVEDLLGLPLEQMALEWLGDAGLGTAGLIVGLLAADVLLPIPSSLVMVLSGAAFGVVWGSLLSLVGSILGEWLGFEMVRRYGRRVTRSVAGDEELAEVNRFFERHGAVAVMVTRPLPIVMETMSLAAGLSRMTRRVFLIASLVGTAPIVAVYAYAGAVSREVGSLLPAAVILVTVTAGAWLWYRSRTR